ncbi:hypothetical protein MJO28_005754 [Puccinia striiformis f. sp. tritici]|uniref:Uncharacterized protein n=3 Tax=Puccinia striiformis TaxID=27350 RepID=A0A2S4VGL0_9BASI|nr:hypothetical protein MJO28_005754 [Puccinia striiformis f. sp. tritici]POV97105.1 hypothetical protein PSHT_14768 [Puccinia striiformis]POW08692.1 hypothetical protein PSTT_07375 [Puccinia striiformis]
MSRIDERSLFDDINKIKAACNTYIMRVIYFELWEITSLPFKDQITYYRTRLAVCRNITSVARINSILLDTLIGKNTRLVFQRLGKVVGETPHLGTASESTLQPAGIICVKRGMVLAVLDNKGHEEYLKPWDRVLLVAIQTESLVVKPLTGEKMGLNLGIRRLIYPLNRRHELGLQFPVLAAFAMLGSNADKDAMLTQVSYHEG